MKNAFSLIAVFALLMLVISGCGKREASPVEAATDASNYQPGHNAAGYYTLVMGPAGGPFSQPAGMAVVDHNALEALIVCQVATLLDVTSLAEGFTLVSTDGDEVALDFAWILSPETSLDIRPAVDLEYNTTYIFTLAANSLLSASGDMLDSDGDFIGGESPDDDIVLRFTTMEEGGTPGTPVPMTDDNLQPAVISSLYYLLEPDSVISIHWMDLSVAIDIIDLAYDESGAFITKPLSPGIFNSTTVILRDEATGTPVAGDISYDDDTTSTTYTRVKFDPDSELAAGQSYQLVLKAQLITDDAGNKLSTTTDPIYTFTTINATSDSSIVVEDITRPAIDLFSNNGPTFTIRFTEEINPATINGATVSVWYLGEPNVGSYEIGRVVSGGSPTGYATTVTFYPNNPLWSGDVVLIRSSIEDLAGNRKGTDEPRNW